MDDLARFFDRELDVVLDAAKHSPDGQSGASWTANLERFAPETGLMASHEGHEKAIPVDSLHPEDMAEFFKGHKPLLTESPDTFMGLWVSLGGDAYLDVSRWFANKHEAMAFAVQNKQISVWDADAAKYRYTNYWDETGRMIDPSLDDTQPPPHPEWRPTPVQPVVDEGDPVGANDHWHTARWVRAAQHRFQIGDKVRIPQSRWVGPEDVGTVIAVDVYHKPLRVVYRVRYDDGINTLAEEEQLRRAVDHAPEQLEFAPGQVVLHTNGQKARIIRTYYPYGYQHPKMTVQWETGPFAGRVSEEDGRYFKHAPDVTIHNPFEQESPEQAEGLVKGGGWRPIMWRKAGPAVMEPPTHPVFDHREKGKHKPGDRVNTVLGPALVINTAQTPLGQLYRVEMLTTGVIHDFHDEEISGKAPAGLVYASVRTEMPTFRRYAKDVADLHANAVHKAIHRPDLGKWAREKVESYLDRGRFDHQFGDSDYNHEFTQAVQNWLDDVGAQLRQIPHEGYKLIPWAVREIKKGNIKLDGGYNPHAADILRTATRIFFADRNRAPKGIDINQMDFKQLEQFVYDWTAEHAGEEWEQREVVHQLDNGYTFEKVETEADLAREGEMMGHCVGGYCEHVKRGDSTIISLRDPKGLSHVTIEIEGDSRPGSFAKPLPVKREVEVGSYEWDLEDVPGKQAVIVNQIQGKQNRDPVDEYKEMVRQWFADHPQYTFIYNGWSIAGAHYEDNEEIDGRGDRGLRDVEEALEKIPPHPQEPYAVLESQEPDEMGTYRGRTYSGRVSIYLDLEDAMEQAIQALWQEFSPTSPRGGSGDFDSMAKAILMIDAQDHGWELDHSFEKLPEFFWEKAHNYWFEILGNGYEADYGWEEHVPDLVQENHPDLEMYHGDRGYGLPDPTTGYIIRTDNNGEQTHDHEGYQEIWEQHEEEARQKAEQQTEEGHMSEVWKFGEYLATVVKLYPTFGSLPNKLPHQHEVARTDFDTLRSETPTTQGIPGALSSWKPVPERPKLTPTERLKKALGLS